MYESNFGNSESPDFHISSIVIIYLCLFTSLVDQLYLYNQDSKLLGFDEYPIVIIMVYFRGLLIRHIIGEIFSNVITPETTTHG